MFFISLIAQVLVLIFFPDLNLLYHCGSILDPDFNFLIRDPLAIVYEYAHWNKQTVGSRMLRSWLRKVLAIDADKTAQTWCTICTGSSPTPLS